MHLALNDIIKLVEQYKYLILFPIAIVEGPIIAIIAGFLAAHGYLNVVLAYGVLVLGDLVGDTIYYAIGRWGGRPFVRRWGRFFGLHEGKLSERTERQFEEHPVQTLFFGKTHALGSVILVGAGMVKMQYGKFIWLNLLATSMKALFFFAVGYYFGQAYMLLARYLNYAGIIATVLAIAIIVLWLWKRK